MTEHVLVAGGSGCVGRHVEAAFRDGGARTSVAARRDPGHPAARYVPVDLTTCTAGDLAALLAEHRITTVVNAVLGWGRDDDEMELLNVRPAAVLVEALGRLRSAPRLVHLGTVHEYGPMEPGTSAAEDAPLRPQSSYARAKVVASRLVVAAVEAGTIDGVVLRLTNTVGPQPAPGSFLGSLAARLHAAAPGARLEIPVVEAHRDYVDVRDAAAAVVAAARSGAADPVVNVGSGEAYDMRRLAAELVAIAGLTAGSLRDGRVAGGGQSGGSSTDWIRLCTRRARERLGWRPRYSITDSLRDMYSSPVPG